jgi:hypothetical protein
VGLVACAVGILFFTLQLFVPVVPAMPPLLPTLLYAAQYTGLGVPI